MSKLRKGTILAAAALALAGGAAFGYDNSPARVIVLPEIIWAQASGGGTWVSEVQVMTLKPDTVVTATFYSGRGSTTVDNLATSTLEFELLKFPNILQAMQAKDPSYTYYGKVGALKLSSQDDAHPIVAVVREVNGNFGKTANGLQWTDSNTANVGRPMMIMNLTNNAKYRSFVGFWNWVSGDKYMLVEFALIDAQDREIGKVFYEGFEPNEYLSFNPFAKAGIAGQAWDNVYLWVNPQQCETTGAGSRGLFCYGASANNATNDPAAHVAVQFY